MKDIFEAHIDGKVELYLTGAEPGSRLFTGMVIKCSESAVLVLRVRKEKPNAYTWVNYHHVIWAHFDEENDAA
jgi:hypothetical protein